jgi:hypothetical protein
MEVHTVSWSWNGGTPANGAPSAFFLDCTCGWGMDVVSEREELAERYGVDHMKEEREGSMTSKRRSRDVRTGDQAKCEYFMLCTNDAIGTLPNPVLGPVACCARCADQVGAGNKLTRYKSDTLTIVDDQE